MKKISAAVLLIVMISGGLYGQRESLYSQYMFNRLVINPAYAASRNAFQATMVYRNQWVSQVPGAPQTMTFSLQAPTRNERVGLGFYVYGDRTGPLQDLVAMANYAYRVQLWSGVLSMGLQAGVTHVSLDESKLNPRDQGDPIYQYTTKPRPQFDANLGFYYYTNEFYLGLSSKNLFESQYGWAPDKDNVSTYGKLARHFYGMTGFAFDVTDDVVLVPSGMVRYAVNAPVNWDVNLSALFADVVWGGVSYRSNFDGIDHRNGWVLMAQLDLTRNWRLGYSYDISTNPTKQLHRGSHEFMLSYELEKLTKRLLTPRYF